MIVLAGTRSPGEWLLSLLTYREAFGVVSKVVAVIVLTWRTLEFSTSHSKSAWS